MDFGVPEDHRGKIKESEKIGKYLDLARKFFKKLQSIQAIVIVGRVETVPKGLERRLE